MVTIASADGQELRAMDYIGYDFENSNVKADFEIEIILSDWQEIPAEARIYRPGTEYGGIFKWLDTNTKTRRIIAGGYTWRGMMRNKIIEPPSGEDYATDLGDVNDIIKARVEEYLGGLFTGAAPIGVSVSYQYKRYCTLEAGLTDMLATVGYKPRIRYDNELKKVVVDAVPIVDFTEKELSSDMSADYHVIQNRGSVNHLICLGSGQLSQRIVVHLYTDEKGNISRTPTFTGTDEITAVYDFAAADEEQLIENGTEQLKTLQKRNSLSMNVEGGQVGIGDIVGGRDYITGIAMMAKVTGIIHKSKNGIVTTEYTISDTKED